MSNPTPYGASGEQGTPWPQYGQDGANGAMPAQGAYPGAGYSGPAVMPTMKLPSRAPGTIMIVVGVLMMLIVAPIVFFVLMFQGASSLGENMANGTVVHNGGTVEVGSNGSYTVSLSEAATERTCCSSVPRGPHSLPSRSPASPSCALSVCASFTRPDGAARTPALSPRVAMLAQTNS